MSGQSEFTRRQLLLGAGGAAVTGAGLFWYMSRSGSNSGLTAKPSSTVNPTSGTAAADGQPGDPSAGDVPEELSASPNETDAVDTAEDEGEAAGLFAKEEVDQHQFNIDEMVAAAALYLDNVYKDHTDFYREHKISKFYGNRNPRYQTEEGRINDIVSLGGYSQAQATAIANQQEPTACILLTMQALEHGFKQVDMGTTWDKIHSQLAIDNKFLGTDLQIMLQQLGWKIYYWNPDPTQNEAWDAEDKLLNPLEPGKEWNPVWGGHAIRYSNIQNKKDDQGRGIYDLHGPGVEDYTKLVGFGTQTPEALKSAPFFVGIAHAGYHVFPGRKGEVIESHSTRKLNDITNVEFSDFNPLGGGGPRWTNSEKYRSGLVAVPHNL